MSSPIRLEALRLWSVGEGSVSIIAAWHGPSTSRHRGEHGDKPFLGDSNLDQGYDNNRKDHAEQEEAQSECASAEPPPSLPKRDCCPTALALDRHVL